MCKYHIPSMDSVILLILIYSLTYHYLHIIVLIIFPIFCFEAETKHELKLRSGKTDAQQIKFKFWPFKNSLK